MRSFEKILDAAGVPSNLSMEAAGKLFFDKVDGRYVVTQELVAVLEEEITKKHQLINELEGLIGNGKAIEKLTHNAEKGFQRMKETDLKENDLITAAYILLRRGVSSLNANWGYNPNCRDLFESTTLTGPFNYVKRQMFQVLETAVISSTYMKLFLNDFESLGSREVEMSIYKNKLSSQLRYLAANSYDWSSRIAKVDLNCPTETVIGWVQGDEEIKRGTGGHMTFNISNKDMNDLCTAKIDMDSFKVNSKRGVIGGIEPVDSSELEKALKKITTVVGDQTITAYKITKGVKILNLRICCDSWNVRRSSLKELNSWVETLEGHYYVKIEANDKEYIAVASSLGRALASSAKQFQGAILSSFDLDFS